MYNSFWRSTILGRYSSEDEWVGLDYKKLFLDPSLARITYIHEVCHSLLGKTTEFGQATTTLFQTLPKIRIFSKKEDREKIEKELMESQLFVQEGSATLMQTLSHAREIGKTAAMRWAENHLPNDYYNRLDILAFVFDIGSRYRNLFTKKIPHLSMHTSIRKDIVKFDLLSDKQKLIDYLQRPENNPDSRFKSLIETIRSKRYLVTKSPEKLCKEAGIKYFPDTSKVVVSDFLNYMNKLSGGRRTFTTSNIHEAAVGQEAIIQASQDTILANMNMNLKETGTFLWNTQEFMSHRDEIEVLMVNRHGDLPVAKVLEKLTGQKYEAGIIGFTKTNAKYIVSVTSQVLVSLLNEDLKNKTLITKWGLYTPGTPNMLFFPECRRPNIVIYNTVADMQEKFNSFFQNRGKADYFYLAAAEDHPFQTLLLKDDLETIHLVNTYGNKHISEFMDKYKTNLKKAKVLELEKFSHDLNNVFSVWMGLDWEIDWYHTMLDGRKIIFRK